MLYITKAKQYGNSVQFEVDADGIKDALQQAKEEASRIFDYMGIGDSPTVDVREKP